MIRIYICILVVFFIQACGETPQPVKSKPTGEWIWVNSNLNKQVNNGELSQKEVNYRFIKTKNTCKIDSLKVPIPSPSCYVVPAPDCSYYNGFARGACMAQDPREVCDYSSVNTAKNAQNEIFEACMQLEGWIKVWKPLKMPIHEMSK